MWLLYGILFFSIPIISTIMFIVSLCRYISAKKKNKAVPGTFSDEELQEQKASLIQVGVVAGLFIAIIIGIIVLLYMAVAYM